MHFLPKLFILTLSLMTIGAYEANACSREKGECDIDSKVYLEVLNYSCGSYYVSDDGAKTVARLAAKNEINVEVFKKSFSRTCDFESAVQVGKDSTKNTLNPEVYFEVLRYSCGSYYVSDTGAQIVARMAANDTIDVKTFKEVFQRTCNFDSAREVACVNNVGKYSPNLNNLIGSSFNDSSWITTGNAKKSIASISTDIKISAADSNTESTR